MIKRASLVAALLVLLGGCRATSAGEVTVSWTAPLADNAGSCGARLLIPATDSVWVVFRISGVLRDSVRAARGQSGKRTLTLAAGSYALKSYATHNGVQGCDTTITIRSFAGPDTPAVSSP